MILSDTLGDGAILAGLSAALAFYFLSGVAGMAWLTWRFRGRFSQWFKISARDRADSVLNVCFLLVLLHAGYMRMIAVHSLINHEWTVSGISRYTAPVYLPIALAGSVGVLWWLSYYLLWGRFAGRAWLAVVVLGAGIGYMAYFAALK